MLTSDGIRAMGLWLLGVLAAEKAVRYGRMCERLRTEEGRTNDGRAAFGKGSEHIDLQEAAWQLKDLGIVRIATLGESLLDADLFRLACPDSSEAFVAHLQKSRPDFLIELTERGAGALAEGLSFRSRDPGYRIQASSASEWLIGALSARTGEALNLRQVMESGHSDGKVVVRDDCGNEYGLGTDTYAWAFEVSLWHHARAGNMLSACRTAEQEQIWSDFVGRTDCPRRPDAGAPRLPWDIPFRLADVVDPAAIDHVDSVES